MIIRSSSLLASSNVHYDTGVSLPRNIQNGTQVQYVHRGRGDLPRPPAPAASVLLGVVTPIVIRPERMVPTFPVPKCLKKMEALLSGMPS